MSNGELRMTRDINNKERNRGDCRRRHSIFVIRHSPSSLLFLLALAVLIAAFQGSTVFASPGGSASATEGGAIRVDPGVTQAAPPGGLLEAALFYGVAGGAVISVLGVCVSRNIVRMAVWLFIALGSVSMLYLMLAANFLAAIQLIVYAGGTLVLLIFGVMLTSKSPWVKFECGKGELLAAALVCGSLLGSLCLVVTRTAWSSVETIVPGASIASLGERLLTTYLVPFEVAGILLMIVMVGAAHLARQEE